MSDKENKNNGIGGQFVLFVLWAIVYAETNVETFEALGAKEFYLLSELIVWGTVAQIVAYLTFTVIGLVGEHFEIDCCISISKIGGAVSILGTICIILTQFVFMCIICHNDFHHYFVGYKTFWRSRAFNYSVLGTNHTVGHPIVEPSQIVPYPSAIWPYDMADIIIRVPWGVIWVILFILGGAAAIGGLGWACSYCCGKNSSK